MKKTFPTSQLSFLSERHSEEGISGIRENGCYDSSHAIHFQSPNNFAGNLIERSNKKNGVLPY